MSHVRRLLVAILAAHTWSAGAPCAEPPAPPHARVAQIYRTRCSQCHGTAGTGRGPAAHFLTPAPRDFVEADYKLRSTPAGHLPMASDLERTIKTGIPGTAMPGFAGSLSDVETRALVDVLRNFSPRFDVDGEGVPVSLPPRPPHDVEMIRSGRALYMKLQCAVCHGPDGRGDGPSAGSLTDANGHPVRPRNLALPGMLKGGSRIEDIYRTLRTGMDGSPMTAIDSSLTELELWQLASFIRSLSEQPVPRDPNMPRGGD